MGARRLGAVAVIAETPAQLQLMRAVRERMPALRDVIAVDALDSAARPRAVPRAAGTARSRPRPTDTFTIIYTSGTTGRAKGCVLTHANYRAMLDMVHAGRTCSAAATTSPTCTCRSRTPSGC